MRHQTPQGGGQGAQSEYGLQVLGEEDGHAHRGEHGEHVGEHGAAEGTPPEEAEVDQRVGEVLLAAYEDGTEHEPHEDAGRGQRLVTVPGPFLDAVDDGEEGTE